MLKLSKYLKPYTIGIVLSVVFLIVQSGTNLLLPSLLSEIVNVGIQQSGIEEVVPTELSIDSFEDVASYMTEEEREDFYSSFTLTEDNIYTLKTDISAQEYSELENFYSFAAYSLIQNNQTNYTALEDKLSLRENVELELAKQTGIEYTKQSYIALGKDISQMQNNYILETGALMLAITLVGGVAVVIVSFFNSRMAAGVARDLRNAVFEKVSSFSNKEYDKYSTASLITRSTNDVMQIQTLLTMVIRIIVFAPVMGIGGIILAVRTSASMAWIIVLAVLMLLILIGLVLIFVVPKFKALQKLVDRLNLVARETLNGTLVVRAFGREEFQKDKFNVAITDIQTTNLFINRAMGLIMPSMMLIMNVTSLLVVWVGADYVAQSAIQVGDILAFMQYVTQVIMSFLFVAMIFIFIPRASVSATRIHELLSEEPAIKDPEAPKNISKDKKGTLEFKNVSFKYGGAEEEVLTDINFKVRKGSTVAFIGSTGSGKTTLINLIPRFQDVTKGAVLVGGIDVRELSQKELRDSIGYVPQKSILMKGTIESNIAYGLEEVDLEEIERSARIAQATEFISQKEEGYKSEISQGGTNVSGGQRQRLSIARALAVTPDIFIFDDSFSALDFKTDAALRKALKNNTGDSTVLIVAQRVSSIMEADTIYVLDNGKIVGEGTHRELLNNCNEYYEIASSQLSKEELANGQ